jgi:DHA3 family tetracycline resistance protein-like MFS transporter
MSTQIDIEKPVADAGRWRVLAPFRSREYRLLITAVSLSIFADGMFAVVLALQVIELDNNPVSLSIVTTFWWAESRRTGSNSARSSLPPSPST